MAAGSAQVLQQVLRLIDAHDLYGSVAYPKKHTQKDISDIYLLPFATRGVFTNVALQEPFGLTVIEVRPARWSSNGRCFLMSARGAVMQPHSCMMGPCKNKTIHVCHHEYKLLRCIHQTHAWQVCHQRNCEHLTHRWCTYGARCRSAAR